MMHHSSRSPSPGNGSKRVRYAVAGIGWIAQEAVLPAFQNASNSELVALVTREPKKAEEVGRKHRVEKRVSYDEYDNLLASGAVDAVYIVLPNHQHREFTVCARGPRSVRKAHGRNGMTAWK
jgi:predicted dehydrogenase